MTAHRSYTICISKRRSRRAPCPTHELFRKRRETNRNKTSSEASCRTFPHGTSSIGRSGHTATDQLVRAWLLRRRPVRTCIMVSKVCCIVQQSVDSTRDVSCRVEYGFFGRFVPLLAESSSRLPDQRRHDFPCLPLCSKILCSTPGTVLSAHAMGVGLGKWQPDIPIGTATHKANSEGPLRPGLAWTLMIDNSMPLCVPG